MQQIEVIDSHTGGEPTRVVLRGGPDLGSGSLADQRQVFGESFDHFRSAVVNEPRGSDVLVGALMCEPTVAEADCGVIFFNNVGMLSMCGHGTIGVAVSLAYAGTIEAGSHVLDTPVGLVPFELHDDLTHVTLKNVPSYRHAKDVEIQVDGVGRVRGDIAWGGNWFFLVEDHDQQLDASRIEELSRFTKRIKAALVQNGITGAEGGEIDHIELFAPSPTTGMDGRNFVLCPGNAYDRSPCGTGTSAKVACLAADGKLAPGEVWHQESIIGSSFAASYEAGEGGMVIPQITGSAWITARSTLLIDSRDPFAAGIQI